MAEIVRNSYIPELANDTRRNVYTSCIHTSWLRTTGLDTAIARNAYNEPQRLAETQLTQFHNQSYRTELSAHPSVLATP